MKQIVKQRFHGTENDRDLIEAEIQVDELEELPEPDEFEGKRLIMGSQCWVIGTGDLYGLTSTGDWVKVNFMGNGEGGGGGGTDNYNSLSNLPKLNSITVSGNKDFEDYGLKPISTAELQSMWNN